MKMNVIIEIWAKKMVSHFVKGNMVNKSNTESY